ncbi:formate--tetrahydrofolate ligase [Halomonas elongata]|uniref:Formate--tetrahydrofolate ligase n=1 Tax=Halomonas elongata (strain ATCC 33173 / DSM 2581 / NBRC 15536 / NCIMB 2198 / 1H9) TaxID=768066 RepID=E1VCJ0_HALED|nr:formate--tetrahydrofolate ligase [Halomonas elongata]WBF19628.1 formate--tetrahydrofolate ligase [Halomonas elongata]WPU48493.1 formate--tetrahydrofolate ligase [Halomonas elongata DSM 2581]CBV42345.1 formate--tetrahydrofolate ligase [Halomonas elongata DSM 2581]
MTDYMPWHDDEPLAEESLPLETSSPDWPPPGSPDIVIARAVTPRPITEVAARLGIAPSDLLPYGHTKAKLPHAFTDDLAERPRGKLVLVTSITPTPAGEGKTTATVGLGDGLNRLGHRAAICLREPSLGPCFGMKGGAAGGGRSQVIPMEDINLHFTGDFHAITSAHNLLAALIDNHLHWGNELNLDPERITWKRAMDMNDRALRHLTVGQGGQSVPRSDGFDITAASEIMAILCLAHDLDDLQRRLGEIVVARTRDGAPVLARDLKADGAMAALLRQALAPNLVQTLEHNPAFVHGGPFANIAHGCNSVMATRSALALADVVVTEAGFGADLGAEKFFNIKCRQAGLAPNAVVVVATLRALKMHGGVDKEALDQPDPQAVRRGTANLARHVENIRSFGVPLVVAVNQYDQDSDEEHAVLREACEAMGVEMTVSSHWRDGSAGSEALAERVAALLDAPTTAPTLTYADETSLVDKVRSIATRLYGAADISLEDRARRQLEEYEALGYGHLPVCIAKTQYSFAADPELRGLVEGHVLPIREAELAAGAGFVVILCGAIMRMPGMPRHPASDGMRLDEAGEIEGLS